MPFIAGTVSLVALAIMARKRQLDVSFFTGPLGLAFLYPVVGLIATLSSPDRPQSLYWAGSYISVPIVLWAIGHGSDKLERVRRTIDLTWLIMVFASMALIAYSFLNLDLANAIAHPSILEQCQFGKAWFTDSSGLLRSTGVGRYGAVAALVAIGGIAYGRWRLVWGIVLLAAVLLLLSSGARSSFVAFVGASLLMVLLYGGWKAFLIAPLTTLLILLVLFFTDVSGTILNECLLRSDESHAPKQVEPDTLSVSVITQTDSIVSIKPIGVPAESTPVPATSTTTVGVPAEPTPVPATSTATIGVPTEPTPVPATSTAIIVPNSSTGSTNLIKMTAGSPISFSGRTDVWREALGLVKKSPLIGYGFNADRILLDAHIHNAFIHSLIQTGALGTLPLVCGIVFAWFLFLKTVRHLRDFSKRHSTRIVLAGGMLAFFSIRSIAESSGAFFGIDWLVLAPVLLYLSVVSRSEDAKAMQTSSRELGE